MKLKHIVSGECLYCGYTYYTLLEVMDDEQLKNSRDEYNAQAPDENRFIPVVFTEEEKKKMAEYDHNMGVEGGNSIQ